MLPTQEEFRKSKGFGENVPPQVLKNFIKMRGVSTTKEHGDSGKTPETLPQSLPQLAEGEEIPQMSANQLSNFQSQARSRMNVYFGNIVPFSRISSCKWWELFRELFAHFENSDLILATENYEDANFENCKIQWRQYVFAGNDQIKQAAMVLDDVIVEFLAEHELLKDLLIMGHVDTREIWVNISASAKSSITMIIAHYFDETLEYWSEREYDSPVEMLNNYIASKTIKYDQVLIDFMEFQGFAMYMIWSKCENENTKQNILNALDRQLFEYRLNPQPIYGAKTFLEKVSDDEDFNSGSQSLNKTEYH